jgi:hypothetical protein
MSEADAEVQVYEEYGGSHVGRCIVVKRRGEVEYRLMNIGGIAVVPFDENTEWVVDALVENGYEYTYY